MNAQQGPSESSAQLRSVMKDEADALRTIVGDVKDENIQRAITAIAARLEEAARNTLVRRESVPPLPRGSGMISSKQRQTADEIATMWQHVGSIYLNQDETFGYDIDPGDPETERVLHETIIDVNRGHPACSHLDNEPGYELINALGEGVTRATGDISSLKNALIHTLGSRLQDRYLIFESVVKTIRKRNI